MKYYRVLPDDSGFPDRWFLCEPLTTAGIGIDAREFTYGRRYNGPTPAVVPIRQAGRRVAFNLGAFDLPVVTSEIGSILARVCPNDIERFAVNVGTGFSGFEIVNAIHQAKCVDEIRSNVRKWGPEDHRPDLVGQYIEFNPLVIDPERTIGRHFFRIWGSLVELIVSDEVKEAIEDLPDLGVKFESVSD
jgi:uncharacterized protein DUF1629